MYDMLFMIGLQESIKAMETPPGISHCHVINYPRVNPFQKSCHPQRDEARATRTEFIDGRAILL